MNWKTATAPLELAPDFVRATESIYVVALTPNGRVPLVVERCPGDLETVRLPGLAGWRPFDPLPSLHQRLREEAGVDADELVVMSRYGIPTGERGRATIVLAPQARTFAPPSAASTLRLVALSELTGWLSNRRGKGVRVDARVWVGLLLAERHFARWAQTRLRAEAEQLHRRRPRPLPAESRS
jgi:hypothetical protein